jgi:Spy/CpxP family protein refolding chaperone
MKIQRLGLPALLLVFGLAVAPGAEAQQRGPMGDPAAMVDEHIDALTEAVGLSEEQVELIRPIYEAQAKKMSEVFAQYRGQGRTGMEQARPQLEKLRDETHEQVRSNLTEEQMEPYAAFLEEQQEQMRQRRSEGPPSGS